MSEVIDNRAARIRSLKEIIRHLHAGMPAEQVAGRMREIVCQTDHSEIVAMEQELMAEGMPVEAIQSMCDLHSQVTRDVLVPIAPAALPPGHPVDTFRRENEALRAAVAAARSIMAETGDDVPLRWRQAINDLMDIDKHYQRKEHTFFPALERHGITGPSKVMWAKDDEVRALLKAALEGPAGAERALAAVEEMIYKEDQILLPMCRQHFTESDWAEIWRSSPRYGWCLVEPRQGYRPAPAPGGQSAEPPAGAIMLPTGNLTLEQLTAIFSTLPVDLTFVDADDQVAFFSEGPDRIFARSRAIIGRKVQYCHPPRSVDTVNRILSDFREGRESVAEFWLNFTGRFVHVRYFAVRDGAGCYLGALEVTQDLTRLRTLEGERRLLAYA